MGIETDFRSLRDIWSKLSILPRVFLGTSFLISCLSIGSLADSVWKFKGFVASAIGAYRAVTHPVLAWLSKHTSLPAPELWLDSFIFFLITTSAMVLAILTRRKEYPEKEPRAQYVALIALANITLLLVLVLLSVPYVVVFVVMAPVFLLGLGIGNIENRRDMFMAASYVGAVYLLVAILAAISEGLFKALPAS